jgi:NAD(P)-dependent dehydrogenase (short-subunit alcohol dehydrogenase family)
MNAHRNPQPGRSRTSDDRSRARREVRGLGVGEPMLDDQTVLVIGGSAGIGLETARRARHEGAEVIITARDPNRLLRAGVDLGGSVAAFDATDFDRLQRFVDELREPLDHILLTGPASYEAALTEFDASAIRLDVEAHLMLPLHVARHARSIVRPGGTLTFIGCTDGRRNNHGIAFTSALTAALSAITRDLAVELAPIRVNLIAAGFVETSPRRRCPTTSWRHEGTGSVGSCRSVESWRQVTWPPSPSTS